MELGEALRVAHEALERAGVDHALIGGLAIAAHVQNRTTVDVDLLVEGEQREQARSALFAVGFTMFHESQETMQLTGPGVALDVLLARRPPTRAMLAAAVSMAEQPVKVLRAEDLIGLKIQAYTGNRRREYKDKADIQALMRLPGLDWTAVKRYADIFGEWNAIQHLRPT